MPRPRGRGPLPFWRTGDMGLHRYNLLPQAHSRILGMADPLTGLRVRTIIDEDGTEKPPSLPPGTITRELTGPDRGVYHLVVLDGEVRCTRASTGNEWTLHELVVAPRYEGDSLRRLLAPSEGKPLVVGIANVVCPLDDRNEVLDFRHTAYFALGRAKRV